MKTIVTLFLTTYFAITAYAQDGTDKQEIPKGFELLFNGNDFTNWIVPEGDGGHWKVVDGLIDYDAKSEAEDKNLWTEKEYEDFILYVDWKIKETPFENPGVPIVKPDGTHKKDAQGNVITMKIKDSDSGIYLRGSSKSQINIWCWPIGSGEVYGYRMDSSMPPEVRRGTTPLVNADNDIGEWNTFKIKIKGDRLTVDLNGQRVLDNAQLPGIPKKGKIALQHHGQEKDGEWTSPPSLVQYKNIYIKEL